MRIKSLATVGLTALVVTVGTSVGAAALADDGTSDVPGAPGAASGISEKQFAPVDNDSNGSQVFQNQRGWDLEDVLAQASPAEIVEIVAEFLVDDEAITIGVLPTGDASPAEITQAMESVVVDMTGGTALSSLSAEDLGSGAEDLVTTRA